MSKLTLSARRSGSLLLLLALLLPARAAAAPADQNSIGIFPVFEMGDSKLGSAFAQHLTAMVLRQLQAGGLTSAMLLNPGGLYSGSLDAETLDYARSNNVSVALVSTLLSTEIPEKGDFLVRVDSKLVDVASGKEIASWQNTAPVNRHEFMNETASRYGRQTVAVMPGGTVGAAAFDIAELSGNSSHPFEKTAVGKAAEKIAADIGSQVGHNAPPGPAPAPAAAAASCNVDFRVSYPAKHASSKSYDIIVNGKNETLDIKDGKVPLTLSSGPVLVQLAVHDAPYKMPKQDLYQANTRLACASDQHTLVMEIDQVGEGTLKWQE